MRPAAGGRRCCLSSTVLAAVPPSPSPLSDPRHQRRARSRILAKNDDPGLPTDPRHRPNREGVRLDGQGDASRSCLATITKEEGTVRKSGSVHEDRSLNGAAVPSSDRGREAVADVSEELRHLLAEVFALYVKTKNFHWHMTGREFRDYHPLLDEQAEQIFAMTDEVAERARKIGAPALNSISDISKHQRIDYNSVGTVRPDAMLRDVRI